MSGRELFGSATHEGACDDTKRILDAPPAIREELIETLVLSHRVSCTDIECDVCGMLDCPVYDSMHNFYDGCPSCREPPPEKPPRRRKA